MTQAQSASKIYKVILVGDHGVGKTTLMLKCAGEEFKRIIGIDFRIKRIRLGNGQVITFQIFDVNGGCRLIDSAQRLFRSMTVLLLFDLSKLSSFDNAVNYWMNFIKDERKHTTIFLIGSKSDLIEERKLSQERAHIVADELGLRYFEADESNIDIIFKTLAQDLEEIHS